MHKSLIGFLGVVGCEGFEPSTNGLKVHCSTPELTTHVNSLLPESVTRKLRRTDGVLFYRKNLTMQGLC